MSPKLPNDQYLKDHSSKSGIIDTRYANYTCILTLIALYFQSIML
mgnify:CR=1 FL=1